MRRTVKCDSSRRARSDRQRESGSHEASDRRRFERILADVSRGSGAIHVALRVVDAVLDNRPSRLARAHVAADVGRSVHRDIGPGADSALQVEPRFHADGIGDLLDGVHHADALLRYWQWRHNIKCEAMGQPSVDGIERLGIKRLRKVNQLEPLELLPFCKPREEKGCILV